ncbi:MAG: hypothetical protein HOP29_00355 [Phycisphaerales bacterium]|nr:hypothetical protein [Phycisphaerales bacterium]
MIRPVVRIIACVLAGIGISTTTACKQEPQAAPRPPSTAPLPNNPAPAGQPALPPGHPTVGEPPALPPGHPPIDGGAAPATEAASIKPMPDIDTSAVAFVDAAVSFDGVSFRLPAGWETAETAGGGAFAASRKVQYRLAPADGAADAAEVVITHFPGMRGMDEQNLQRWYGQFTQPDGRPTTQVTTRMDFQTTGGVGVIFVDIPGTIAGGGGMSGTATADKPNYRMLAAIINHANGPHFFKLTGPAASVEKWKGSAVAFLKSAAVNP